MKNLAGSFLFSILCVAFLFSSESFAFGKKGYESVSTVTVKSSFFVCPVNGGCSGPEYVPTPGAICGIAYQGWTMGSCYLDNASDDQFSPTVTANEIWYVRKIEIGASANATLQLIRNASSGISCAQGLAIFCTPKNASTPVTWADVNASFSKYLAFDKTDGALANYCAPDPLFGYPVAGMDNKDGCGYSPIPTQ